MKKIDINSTSKVKIIWDVIPSDFSKEKENDIAVKFSKKYNIPLNNIKVESHFIIKNKNGEATSLTNDVVENIQDPKFQQSLFKRYIIENDIKDCDFDKIIEIDNKINSLINYDLYDKYRRYSIKWIKWANFMSYGENNFFDFTNLRGLILLNGNPENQSGKSTFCNDLVKFLLFGKISSRNNDWTLSEAFNLYKPEATELYVEGCIIINGEEFIINRTLTRPELKRRTSKSKVTQKVTYYKLINGEKIELSDNNENFEGSTNVETNKIIKESIGNEKDFDLVICANSDNLKSLISLKDTERGRLLSRWIGLLPLEEKDKISRDKFNKEIYPRLILNKYNKETLNNSNDELLKQNVNNNELLNKNNTLYNESLLKIKEYETMKDSLLLSKKEVDKTLLNVDVKTIETSINNIIDKLNKKTLEKDNNIKKLNSLKDISFSEDEYKNKISMDKNLSIELNTKRNECKYLKNEIKTLKESEYCPTCGSKLKNVDNSKLIQEKENLFNQIVIEGKKLSLLIDKLKIEIASLEKKRSEYNEKNRLELIVDTNIVDIENLKSQLKEKRRIIDDLNKNKDIIENNNKIDLSLNILYNNISNETKYKDTLFSNIQEIKKSISINDLTIKNNNKIIEQIINEESLVKNWKIYLDMVGKNGISKMVLKNALPLINNELNRLLNDVCDFQVEVMIDDHNDVSFFLIRNGVKSNLGSGSGYEQTCAGLALRVILGNISTLPRPNYIILDEILGGVAEENYDKIKLLYDRIVKDYSFIFQITHLKSIIDWHDSIISVEKNNNISKILI